MGKHNFLSKMFKPVGNTFNHVITNPINDISGGVNHLLTGVGEGVSGVGSGFNNLGSSLGSTLGTFSNPILLIGVGVGAIILINAIQK